MLALYDKLTHIGIEQSICGKSLCKCGQPLDKTADKVSEVIDVSNTQSSILKTLTYKSIDMEARSRRNHLIFWGFSESHGENCFALIREFVMTTCT